LGKVADKGVAMIYLWIIGGVWVVWAFLGIMGAERHRMVQELRQAIAEEQANVVEVVELKPVIKPPPAKVDANAGKAAPIRAKSH
jgi:hypothetical protein